MTATSPPESRVTSTSTSTSTRWLVFALLLVSLVLLIPGLFTDVLIIRGVLTRDGIAQVAPMMLEKGLNDDTLTALKAMMNPTVVGLIEATGGAFDPRVRGSARANHGRCGGPSARRQGRQLHSWAGGPCDTVKRCGSRHSDEQAPYSRLAPRRQKD